MEKVVVKNDFGTVKFTEISQVKKVAVENNSMAAKFKISQEKKVVVGYRIIIFKKVNLAFQIP